MRDSPAICQRDNRVAAYIRVSDDSQIESYSLEAQEREIRRWCVQRGYEVAKIYTEAGVSAHHDEIGKRPELVRLLAEANLGQFDIVVVHMLCRWARRLRVQQEALWRLGKVKVGFASVCDPIDYSTPHGRFILSQLGAMNEFQSDLIGAHVSKSFKTMAEDGLAVGPVPFGYRRPYHLPEDKAGVPAFVEEEAQAVRECFGLRVEGHSYGQIATWLNAHGFRTIEGHAFTPHAVKDLLCNRFYCGYVKYRGQEFKGKHVAIISEGLFQRVKDRRQRRERVRTVHGPKGLAQGMVACWHCGNGLQSDRHRQQVPLYRERHAHQCMTNNTSIVSDVIDSQLALIVHAMALPSSWKEKLAELVVAKHDGPDPGKLKEKKRRLIRAYGDGDAYTDEEYRRKLAEIDQQMQQTLAVPAPAIDEAAELFSNLPVLWAEATQDERGQLLRSLIERVYVDLKGRMVRALKPTIAFRALFSTGMEIAPDALVELVSSGGTQHTFGVGGDGGELNLTRNVAYFG